MAKYFRLALETALELKTQEIITNETDMNTIKTKLIAGTMTLALARTAFRLYAGDSQAERYALHSTAYTSASPSAGGFPIGQLYLGADAGLALQQDVTIKDSGGSKISFDPGTRVDVAVGYHFTDAWAAEFQTGVVYNSIDKIAGISLDSQGLSASLYEIPLMANVTYTLPVRERFSAYLGAGVGGVVGLFHGESPGETTDHTDFTFGYQGIAGIKYALNERMHVGLVYKFLGTTDHDLGSGEKSEGTRTHSVLVAFTLKF